MHFSLTNDKACLSYFSSLEVLSLYLRHALLCSIFLASVWLIAGLIEALYVASSTSFSRISRLMGASGSLPSTTAWVSRTILLTLPRLALHSVGWVVSRAVYVSTVNFQCIQYWRLRPSFFYAVHFWFHGRRWSRHGGLSSPKFSASGILTLSDNNQKCCFQVYCINLYFYLM